ncbi:MAG: hypothetical protein HN542_11575 [Flavobacteriales bacterium]|jgi:hypothetical protein|nr:hypothetical protein [Flavobacteriales bacterium]MBT3962872.1 hypothetical protein [Flavobacteriales bacterium]MBT4704700.1 hypothetical protein [Flavobacteriales bacterium]MBT4931717.1 hypothetical protein [Flavobacteriales bacterium]MBT5133683.1 hypothetical protein [Flavobacteriales bacterium]
MNRLTIISFVFVFGASTPFVQGQQDDTLKTRIIQVIDYKPTISDARKLGATPVTIDTTMDKPSAQFEFENRRIYLNYQPESIAAAKMKGEPLDPLTRAYLKAGAGNGINYLLDGYVNTLRSRTGALGIGVHGIGTQGVLTDLSPAPYSKWNAEINGKRFLKKHQLTGDVSYERERVQFYGYDDTNPYYFLLDGENVFKGIYQGINGDFGLKSFYTDSSKLNHVINLHYDHFFDYNAINKEHNVVLDANMSRFFGKHLGRLDFKTDVNALDYAMEFDHYPQGTIGEKPLNTIIGLTPQMISQGEKWRIELGASAQMELSNTQIGGVDSSSSDLFIFPEVYAKYNLVKDVIIPYAEATGGIRRNNLGSVVDENPFLWTSLTAIQNTVIPFKIGGGFRGSVSNRFTYNLSAAQYNEKNSPLYVNYDASQFNPAITRFGENYFTLVYDDLSIVEVEGELTYRIDEKLHTVARGVYRSFKTTDEFEAWHRPSLEVSATAFYQIKNKLIFRGELHVTGPRLAKSYRSTDSTSTPEFSGYDAVEDMDVYAVKLSPIVDFNLGVEYRYTERLSGFISLNNVLIQRYQRWKQYPVQRFNVLAGITYSFWRD